MLQLLLVPLLALVSAPAQMYDYPETGRDHLRSLGYRDSIPQIEEFLMGPGFLWIDIGSFRFYLPARVAKNKKAAGQIKEVVTDAIEMQAHWGNWKLLVV